MAGISFPECIKTISVYYQILARLHLNLRLSIRHMWQQLATDITQNNFKSLARAISLVENEINGYETFLKGLINANVPVTGITGPPGAGKSTLTDALIGEWASSGKKIGVLCIDPSSPFHLGALLGDRIRMSSWYNHPGVFIRSLATRGALGGLHPHIIEIMAVMQASGFDHILIETVGVGQSEIEIAGLADTTVVVLVPESGDEVQTMKAGLMEIADIFVVNKSDRPGADVFGKNLRSMLIPTLPKGGWEIPVLNVVATDKKGIPELAAAIDLHHSLLVSSERKFQLLTERAFRLIQQARVKDIDKIKLLADIKVAADRPGFNLFSFVAQHTQ